ncbi:MAG: hypothetical protein KHX55_06235 [Proteobacteria bacterium]|nr:hypothetical protein [Pseudomonadota bacterium]
MEAKSIIVMALFLAAGMAYVALRIAFAIRQARKRRKRVVVARVKNCKDGLWMCKFFLCGDHPGYFTQKPSADRVKARVIGYDEKNRIYRLEEFSGAEETPLVCRMWLI